MAKKIADEYENMNKLLIHLKKHGKESLKDIEYPTSANKTRKIGKKNSTTIYEFLINNL